ncbi:sugar-binding transcriptional regulator [Patulibacter sp. S7RM1-6]
MADDRTLLRIAHLYYREGLTQQEVAARVGIGRVTVGRLLNEALQRGLVRIEIRHPLARLTELEVEVQRRFALADVVIAQAPDVDDPGVRLDAVAAAAADYLATLRPQPTTLGVSWGRTMHAIAGRMARGWASGVPVVQMNGAVSRSERPTYADQIAQDFAVRGGGMAHLLSAPAIVDRAETREVLEADSAVSTTLELARMADVAIFGLGTISEESVLVESGYLDRAQVDDLVAAGTVGDVLSRFITADGSIADPEIDARTCGLPLTELARKRRSIGVAVGVEKLAITRAAASAGWANALVIDEALAEALLAAGPVATDAAPTDPAELEADDAR